MKQINQSFELKKGDRIQLHYRILSVFENAQINYLLSNINQDGRMIVEDYELESSNWYSDILKINLKVITNPFPLAILILAIGSISTSIFLYLSFDKAYLIAREAPEVMTGVTGSLSFVAIAIIAIIAFFTFK